MVALANDSPEIPDEKLTMTKYIPLAKHFNFPLSESGQAATASDVGGELSMLSASAKDETNGVSRMLDAMIFLRKCIVECYFEASRKMQETSRKVLSTGLRHMPCPTLELYHV